MDLRAVAALVVAAACGRSGGGSSPPPSVRYANHVSAGGVLPQAGTLENPFADSGSVKQGGQLFVAMNCDGCHGGGGTGWVGPSLVDGRWRYGGEDGAVFQSIYYGRPRGMPAYGGILSNGVIWKIVAYIRAQPVPKVVPTQSW